jgi:hypothetical protein
MIFVIHVPILPAAAATAALPVGKLAHESLPNPANHVSIVTISAQPGSRPDHLQYRLISKQLLV